MVLRTKVCDMCKYKVCNEEEYLSATQKERVKFSRLWDKHLRSMEHRMTLEEKALHDSIEYKKKLNDLRSSMTTTFNTLLPEGKKVKGIVIVCEDGSVF